MCCQLCTEEWMRGPCPPSLSPGSQMNNMDIAMDQKQRYASCFSMLLLYFVRPLTARSRIFVRCKHVTPRRAFHQLWRAERCPPIPCCFRDCFTRRRLIQTTERAKKSKEELRDALALAEG